MNWRTLAVIAGLAGFAGSFYLRRPASPPERITALSSSPDLVKEASGGATELLPGAPQGTTVVVFSDYQCPACRLLAQAEGAGRAWPPGTRVLLHHYPLQRIHPHAFDASALAVCASRSRPALDVHTRLFALQDSIGHMSWGRIALAIGASDSLAALHCMTDAATVATVRRGVSLADSLGLRATPAVVSADSIRFGVPRTASRRLSMGRN